MHFSLVCDCVVCSSRRSAEVLLAIRSRPLLPNLLPMKRPAAVCTSAHGASQPVASRTRSVKRLPKASVARHCNERRDAERTVARVRQSLPLASTTPHKRSYKSRAGLLLAVPCGAKSTLEHAFKHYGYALRVAKPERSRKAKKNKPQPVCVKAPPKPPVLRKGKAVVWRLDLRSPKHVTALLQHLKSMPIPKDIDFLHTHGAPPCTWVAPGSPLKHSIGRYSSELAQEGALMLHVSRQIHEVMRRRRRPRSSIMQATKHTYRVTGSHAQPCGSSTATGLKVLGNNKKCGIKVGFPWSVGARAGRTAIGGAVLGAFHGGEPTTARWIVESDNEFLLQCLTEFAATSKPMQNHPKFMAAYMAAAIACDWRGDTVATVNCKVHTPILTSPMQRRAASGTPQRQ